MARLSGLSGKLFPIHLKPKNDELLSSWLVRLAFGHGLSLTDLNRILYPHSKINICQQQDIDLGIRDHKYRKNRSRDLLLATLSKKTGTPLNRARQTTLDEYNERLFYKVISTRLYSWLIPHNSSRFRSEPKFGMQACPRCLDDDEQPYFRRRWRLAFVTVCPQHNCYLIDRCPACGAPIQFQRNVISSLLTSADAMTACYNCRFDLRRVLSSKQPLGLNAGPEVTGFQEHLLRIAKWDYIKGTETSFYFETTHWMLSLLVRPHKVTSRLQSAVFKHYGLDLDLSRSHINCTPQSFDVGRRYELVRVLNRLLIDHPYRYIGPSYRDDFMCRIWLDEWQSVDFWRTSVLSAEKSRRGSTAIYAGKRSGISDLYIYSSRAGNHVVINPQYLDEFKDTAACLFMDGLRVIHIASTLVVSPKEARTWTLEHPASAVAAREAGRRGIKKR